MTTVRVGWGTFWRAAREPALVRLSPAGQTVASLLSTLMRAGGRPTRAECPAPSCLLARPTHEASFGTVDARARIACSDSCPSGHDRHPGRSRASGLGSPSTRTWAPEPGSRTFAGNG